MKNSRLFVLLMLFVHHFVFAQEQAFTPMSFNPSIKQYLKTNPPEFNSRMQSVVNELPFVDDFSATNVYPDANKWINNLVFINSDIARNPPTLGVATFDGADAFGNAYDNVNTNLQGSSDTLTSQPINLFTKPSTTTLYTLADSIYLSFFYQKKGWGDAPETSDSLILEFYKQSTGQWIRQWFIKGGGLSAGDTVFTRVDIALLDTSFYTTDFQFRFRNYGSLSGALDLWHLDYIILKDYGSAGFTTSIQDIAFEGRNISVIYPYTSMPWNHYTVNPSAYIRDASHPISMEFKNLSTTKTFATTFRDEIFNEITQQSIFLNNPGTNNVFPLNDIIYSFAINTLSSPTLDYALFSSVHSLSTDSNNFPTNDSVKFFYPFDNYYSYDDGTSEVGFDLVNSPGGKVAMQYDLAKPDSLRAVRILFVQQNLNVSNKLFSLKVWSSLNPETVIYQQPNLKPVYTDSINGMATYVIPPTFVQGTIYVGFQQVLGDGLHLGYDRNTANNSKMFVNPAGTWSNVTLAPGSFMIRPVMGGSDLFLGVNENNESFIDLDINLYPNPSADIIHGNFKNPSTIKTVSMFDVTGRWVLTQPVNQQFSIKVAHLTNGFYTLRFADSNEQLLTTKKILVNH